MKYGIICAMPEEFGKLENEIKKAQTKTVCGRDFISGYINETEVVAVVSRIGKVAAAVTTTILIDRFNVDAVLFCGIAGGLGDNIKIGDIVIGSGCVQHDFYLSDNDMFRIPLLNISNIPCDVAISEKSYAAAKEFCKKCKNNNEICEFFDSVGVTEPSVHTGIIASGDQFISDSGKKAWIKEKIEGVQCVEMEGAAVAQVCFEASVPCSVIRVISDGADDNADFSFEKFVSAASLYSIGIITEFFA